MVTKIILTPKQLMEWPDLDHRAVTIFWALVNLWPAASLYITSIFRTRRADRKLGGSGVHATKPHRAIDVSIRVLNTDPKVAQEMAEKMCEVLNSLWIYDPTRPAKPVVYCKPHGTGPHIHLQVHPLSRRREMADPKWEDARKAA